MSTSKKEKQDAFLEIYKSRACSIQHACDEIGIHRNTYYKWKDDKEFMERLECTDAEMVTVAKDCVFQAIKNGDSKVAMWLLERKGGYQKVATEQNINVSHRAIAQVEIPEMTDDKFKSIGEKAKAKIPKDDADLKRLAADRFGEEFAESVTFDMTGDTNG